MNNVIGFKNDKRLTIYNVLPGTKFHMSQNAPCEVLKVIGQNYTNIVWEAVIDNNF